MKSYRLRYTGPTPPLSQGHRIHLVPMLDKPLYVHQKPVAGKDECPNCQIIHPVKTHHLWLDQNNTVLVSQGVFDDLSRVSHEGQPYGIQKHDLELAGGTDTPPGLTLDGRKSRRQLDQENETIRIRSS